MLTHPVWNALPGLRHGFLDREECATGDWARIVAMAGAPFPIATPRQVHGTAITVARPGTPPPAADALVSHAPGVLAGIVTADCVPVLLIAPERRLAAAVHAGWRGASAGILEATLAYLAAEFGTGPGDLEAAIGPAVGPCCYEVGEEVWQAFHRVSGGRTELAWSVSGGRRRLDLRAAGRLLLMASGVQVVTVLGPCTSCDRRYSSYRRDGASSGRQLSFVGWA